MPRCFSLVLLSVLCLLPGLVRAQSPTPYVISERVGPVIDAEERAYFGLFPDVEGFTEARAFAAGDSVRIEIGSSAGDSVLVLPRATAEALGRFIETFEQHPSAFQNPNWQVLRPYLRADVPVPYADVGRRDIRIDTRDHRYDGVLLMATDSLVLLQPASGTYDWDVRDGLVLRSSEVERVMFEPKGLQRYDPYAPYGVGVLGATLGAGIAHVSGAERSSQLRYMLVPLLGGLGYELARRYLPKRPPPGRYEERLAQLYEHAAFRDDLKPYDLPPIAEIEARETDYPYEAAPPAPSYGFFRRAYQRYGFVSVGFMAGLNAVQATDPQPFVEYIRGVGEVSQTTEINDLSVTGGLDLSLRLLPWVRIGGSTLLRDDEVLDESDGERINVKPARLRGYVELVVPSPQLGDYRLDLSLGAGIEQNSLSVARVGGIGEFSDFTYRVEESFSNTYWQGTLEVFSSRYISYFLRYTRRSHSQTITVPGEGRRVVGLPGTWAYLRDPHDIEVRGYSDLFWGTRLHF